METVVPAPVEPELNLLTPWEHDAESRRRRTAAFGTLAAHAVAILILISLPESFFEEKQPPEVVRHITPIYEPLTKLTQKAPNTAKAVKEFSVQQPEAHPRPPAPAPVPAGPKREPVRRAVIPKTAPPKPEQTLPEPPKAEASVKAPKLDVPQLGTMPPPPKIEAQETPKLPLESLDHGPPPVVPPDKRVIPIPDASPSAAIRNLSGGGAPRVPNPLEAPDTDQHTVQLPQLLSDTQGIDFTPYLRQILLTVKRNWQAVMPQSVRLGQRGKVSIVFSIDREGRVVKLVYNAQSGIEAFDKAAVSGISASNPFPPLPPAFRGNQIVVQFNFAYNTPKQ